MEKFYGVNLDKNKINKAQDIVNSIPPKPNFEDFDDFKLTDNELKSVAGGWKVTLAWTLVCFGNEEEEEEEEASRGAGGSW